MTLPPSPPTGRPCARPLAAARRRHCPAGRPRCSRRGRSEPRRCPRSSTQACARWRSGRPLHYSDVLDRVRVDASVVAGVKRPAADRKCVLVGVHRMRAGVVGRNDAPARVREVPVGPGRGPGSAGVVGLEDFLQVDEQMRVVLRVDDECLVVPRLLSWRASRQRQRRIGVRQLRAVRDQRPWPGDVPARRLVDALQRDGGRRLDQRIENMAVRGVGEGGAPEVGRARPGRRSGSPH